MAEVIANAWNNMLNWNPITFIILFLGVGMGIYGLIVNSINAFK